MWAQVAYIQAESKFIHDEGLRVVVVIYMVLATFLFLLLMPRRIWYAFGPARVLETHKKCVLLCDVFHKLIWVMVNDAVAVNSSHTCRRKANTHTRIQENKLCIIDFIMPNRVCLLRRRRPALPWIILCCYGLWSKNVCACFFTIGCEGGGGFAYGCEPQ